MYKLIDMMSQVDLSFLDEISLDDEIEKLHASLEDKKKWGAKQIAILSSIAAGSIALTSIIVILCKKSNGAHKVA